MNDFIEIMVDLETMSTETDAAIVSIGAVHMDFKRHGVFGKKFYGTVDLESSMESGGHVSAFTIKWWLMQSEGARKALVHEPVPLWLALTKFAEWVLSFGPREKIRIWGKGAAFDNVVLRGAYRRLNCIEPWHFRNDMCYRTMEALNKDVQLPIQTGTAHNALDDAMRQGLHLIEIMRRKE